VDFTLNEEQVLLRETARAMFGNECPPSLIRDAFYDVTSTGPQDARTFFDRHLRDWAALGDAPVVDLCLFMEEAGRVLAPGPGWVNTSMFLPLLRLIEHPSADQVAAGEITGTVAVCGSDGYWVLSEDPVRSFVPHAKEVGLVAILSAQNTVSCVPATELNLQEVATLDRSRPVFQFDVPVGLDTTDLSAEELAAVLNRGTVALAAELIGVGRWLMDATLDYVRERVQFDRPVGSFQGLQWKLVDAALLLERADAAVYFAAMCLDSDAAEQHHAVHVAKAAAGAAARRWARDGLQSLGGIGFTWEHDLHLRLRRSQASEQLLGSASWHHDRLAELIFSTG